MEPGERFIEGLGLRELDLGERVVRGDIAALARAGVREPSRVKRSKPWVGVKCREACR
jgi:hypothetical protein